MEPVEGSCGACCLAEWYGGVLFFVYFLKHLDRL